MLYRALAEEVGTVAEQVTDLIETAGDKASTVVSRLPGLATRLAMGAVVILIGMVVYRAGRRMISIIVKTRGKHDKQNAQQVETLRSLVTSVYKYLLFFVLATVVLSLFGVNVSSLLTVAGVGGIAISFGAQTLVKDIISGLFIWTEGTLSVGDIVDINGLQGTVEAVNLRSTVVRNYNGNLQTIPNGDIRTVINMTSGFKRAIVDVRCPYEEDPRRVEHILQDEMEKAGREIVGLTEAPTVMSIVSFDKDAMLMRIAVQCQVGEHWRIEREIRTRVKVRFDKEGIMMPHYQRPPVD